MKNKKLHHSIFTLSYLVGKIHLGSAYKIDFSDIEKIKSEIKKIAKILRIKIAFYNWAILDFYEENPNTKELRNTNTCNFLREFSYYVGCLAYCIAKMENFEIPKEPNVEQPSDCLMYINSLCDSYVEYYSINKSEDIK